MALILSIETATPVCSIALHEEDRLISCQSLYLAKSHAESLLQMIADLFKLGPYTQADLTAVAISQGPGSYTGLRIGAATAKGFCYALDIPLIAVNTLEAMAYGVNIFNCSKSFLCPMIDARRMEVYYLLAHASGNIVEETQAKVIDEHSFQSWLAQNQVIFFGDGAAKCKPVLGKQPKAIFLEGVHASAQHIGALAYSKFQQRNFEPIATFEPCYLKPFQGKPMAGHGGAII
jgi:tRNA threonylcarbamoyladenosine biosynthesis protein TsaB